MVKSLVMMSVMRRLATLVPYFERSFPAFTPEAYDEFEWRRGYWTRAQSHRGKWSWQNLSQWRHRVGRTSHRSHPPSLSPRHSMPCQHV